jgi:MYXO-CTERM domain-containing protein
MMSKYATAALLAATAGGASAQTTEIFSFDGLNHTDGNINDQAYGLRLDNFGGEAPATFSFEDASGSTVSVSIELPVAAAGGMSIDGAATLTISGTISGNSANGGTDFGDFTLFAQYEGTWDATNTIFTATTADAFTGSVTGLATTAASPIADGESFALTAKPRNGGSTLYFGDGIPGSRRDAGDTRLEGFGWVMSPESSGTQDFLFLVDGEGGDTPTPAGAAALALGGLLASRRRRG